MPEKKEDEAEAPCPSRRRAVSPPPSVFHGHANLSGFLTAENFEEDVFFFGEFAAEETAELLRGGDVGFVEGEENIVGLQAGEGEAFLRVYGLDPNPFRVSQHLDAGLNRLEETH